jgi:hypothetical protein
MIHRLKSDFGRRNMNFRAVRNRDNDRSIAGIDKSHSSFESFGDFGRQLSKFIQRCGSHSVWSISANRPIMQANSMVAMKAIRRLGRRDQLLLSGRLLDSGITKADSRNAAPRQRAAPVSAGSRDSSRPLGGGTMAAGGWGPPAFPVAYHLRAFLAGGGRAGKFGRFPMYAFGCATRFAIAGSMPVS